MIVYMLETDGINSQNTIMEEEEGVCWTVMRFILYGLIGFFGVIFVFNFNELIVHPLRDLFGRRWIYKHYFKRILRYFNLHTEEILTETETAVPKVNCQALVLIENLPNCTTAKDLVKCLGLKEFVNRRKLVKVSVAADKKGNCAGLAVALVPRYCLHHCGILSKHKSLYSGNIIKVKEVKNRKINLRKQLNWLSSDNYNQVGFRGRFQVYHNVLQDFTTQHGYYLIDGGCLLQFYSDPDDIIIESASAGIDKIVMKMKHYGNIEKSELAWCKSYPGYIFTTLGIGPRPSEKNDPIKIYNDMFAVLEDKNKNKHIVAIGECGIDTERYYGISGKYEGVKYVYPDKEREKELFRSQVKLASFFSKPLLVQASKDVDDILDVLEDFPDVMACLNVGYLTPSETAIKKWVKKGYYLGISGMVFSSEKQYFWLPSVLKTVPLDRIILCSNGPNFYRMDKKYGKDRFIADIKQSEYFKNVNKQSVSLFGQDEEDERVMEPKGLCVVLELLSACVNKPPQTLAQILKTNAEQFYKFDSLDKL